jgi:hypothetical protein
MKMQRRRWLQVDELVLIPQVPAVAKWTSGWWWWWVRFLFLRFDIDISEYGWSIWMI